MFNKIQHHNADFYYKNLAIATERKRQSPQTEGNPMGRVG